MVTEGSLAGVLQLLLLPREYHWTEYAFVRGTIMCRPHMHIHAIERHVEVLIGYITFSCRSFVIAFAASRTPLTECISAYDNTLCSMPRETCILMYLQRLI
jgi:hypothetical protein